MFPISNELLRPGPSIDWKCGSQRAMGIIY